MGYIDRASVNEVDGLIEEVGKLLWSIQKSKLQP
jgi:hypothetical protein